MGKRSAPGKNKPVKNDLVNKVENMAISEERNKRNQLVNELLRVTSDGSRLSPAKSWELHLVISDLLKKIMELEEGMECGGLERTKERLAGLRRWAEENGADISRVELADYGDMGLGLRATADIKQGALILAIPRTLMLTSEAIKTSFLKSLWETDPLVHNMSNVTLALAVLAHRLDPASFWAPYISTLPPFYDTVMYFTNEDLLQLKGSPLFEKAVNQCRSIARQYAYFYSIFQTSNDPSYQVFRDHFTYNSYRWSTSTVMTRQNVLPGGVHGLIPFWDMANHSDLAEMSTDYNSEKVQCECLAWRGFSKGDQVEISYGCRPSWERLLHSGFVPESPHQDWTPLRLGLAQADPAYHAKARLLHCLGLPHTDEWRLQPAPSPQPFHSRLVDFLAIITMPQEEAEEAVGGDVVAAELTPTLQTEAAISRAHTFLHLRIKLLLQAYQTSLEEDEELLKSEGLSSGSRLAIRLRKREKEILRHVQQYLTVKVS